jgi:hypothetical protein
MTAAVVFFMTRTISRSGCENIHSAARAGN